METIQVFLTTAQKRNFEHGKAFQLSSSQLQETTGKHHVEIHLSAPHYHKLMKNIKGHKGFRFTPEIVLGGSILSSLGKAAKSVGRFIAHNVSKDAVKSGLNGLAMVGSTALGHPELGALASHGINMAVDAGYGHHDKSVSMRDHAMNTARDIGHHYAPQAEQYAQHHHPHAYQAYQVGRQIHSDYQGYGGRGVGKSKEARVHPVPPRSALGSSSYDTIPQPPPPSGGRRRSLQPPSAGTPPLMRPDFPDVMPSASGKGLKKRGGKLKKGSAEMKEKMARLRSMRKGGDILGNLRKAFDPKQNGVAKAFNQAKTTVAPYIRPAITQGIAAGIDMMTGTPIGSIATPGISRAVNSGLDRANIGVGLRGRGKRIHTKYGGLIGGIPTPILTQRAHDMINTMGLTAHRHTPNGLPNMGGSFLPL